MGRIIISMQMSIVGFLLNLFYYKYFGLNEQ